MTAVWSVPLPHRGALRAIDVLHEHDGVRGTVTLTNGDRHSGRVYVDDHGVTITDGYANELHVADWRDVDRLEYRP